MSTYLKGVIGTALVSAFGTFLATVYPKVSKSLSTCPGYSDN